MEKETIVRKDGIIYERRKKSLNQTFTVTIRIQKEKVEKLKLIAESQGKKYQPLIKELIDKYLEEYENER